MLAIRTGDVEVFRAASGKHRDRVRPTTKRLRLLRFRREASDATVPCVGMVHTAVIVILILTISLPGRLGIVHAQDVSSVLCVDHRGARTIADPCQDPLTPSALRKLYVWSVPGSPLNLQIARFEKPSFLDSSVAL